MESFTKDKIFTYNQHRKIRFVVYVSLVVFLLLIFAIYYVLALKNSDFILVKIINSLFSHVTYHFANTTLLGSFYATLFGGLFFIPVPLEVLFLTFLNAGHSPWLILLLYMAGMIISFTINYFIGMNLSEISKKIITPQRFYKIKVSVNKYGMLAVFVFNILPLPAQALSALLGVFKYNWKKFYIAFIAGELIKFVFIILTLGSLF